MWASAAQPEIAVALSCSEEEESRYRAKDVASFKILV